MKYKVVKVLNEVEKLEEEVNKLLSEGWQLYGDLSAVASISQTADNKATTTYLYTQVMTKEN
jgi:hypothetical protein